MYTECNEILMATTFFWTNYETALRYAEVSWTPEKLAYIYHYETLFLPNLFYASLANITGHIWLQSSLL